MIGRLIFPLTIAHESEAFNIIASNANRSDSISRSYSFDKKQITK